MTGQSVCIFPYGANHLYPRCMMEMCLVYQNEVYFLKKYLALPRPIYVPHTVQTNWYAYIYIYIWYLLKLIHWVWLSYDIKGCNKYQQSSLGQCTHYVISYAIYNWKKRYSHIVLSFWLYLSLAYVIIDYVLQYEIRRDLYRSHESVVCALCDVLISFFAI